MKKNAVTRVKNLTKRKLKAGEVVYVGGVPTKLTNSHTLQRFVESGQLVVVNTLEQLKLAKPQRQVLFLVAENQELAQTGKEMSLKVEHHDHEGIKDVLNEALTDDVYANEKIRSQLPTKLESTDRRPEDEEKSERKTSMGGAGALHADDSAKLIAAHKSSTTDNAKPLVKFARAFTDAAADSKGGIVGSRTVRQLADSAGVEMSNQILLGAGWLEPHTKPGKQKVGGYKAAEPLLKLLEEAGGKGQVAPDDKPEDTYERAKWLIARKPSLAARKAKLEAEIAEIDDELEAAANAEEWLKQANF